MTLNNLDKHIVYEDVASDLLQLLVYYVMRWVSLCLLTS
jgi:hypothetical protein